ncbi:MAG TPA: DNA alkylation repair protein [Chitinophagaceae bacterium]|nr:DNA alkylation repair protein [Chitinophagaceae bacterium]
MKKTVAGILPPQKLTAKELIAQMRRLSVAEDAAAMQRYFKTGKGEYGEGDIFLGVRTPALVALVKAFAAMPTEQIEILLESPLHEARAAAVHIMDKAARSRKTSAARRKALYELFMRRLDRINNWDLVDIACLHMTGMYLIDKPKKILYTLAVSGNRWKRRVAMVSTCYFIRQGQLKDCFAIATLLLHDKEDLIQKAAGWMLRMAGSKDPQQLYSFLDAHAVDMPRTMLRYSIEKLDDKRKGYYLSLKKKVAATKKL